MQNKSNNVKITAINFSNPIKVSVKRLKPKVKVIGKKGAELNRNLARRKVLEKQLYRLNKEYKEINDSIKEEFEGRGEVETTNFILTGFYVNKEAYSVSALTYWGFKIQSK